MLRVAAFIDAGYLWRQVGKVLASKADGKQVDRSKIELRYMEFHNVLIEYLSDSFKNIPLLRCYWYDGPFIPHEIDKRLLRAGYLDNGHRALTEIQKRSLRADLRGTATRYQADK